MAEALLKNGCVWDGEQFHRADVLVADGKIAAIANEIVGPADFIFDATGKIVSAGLIDAHTHLRGVSSPDIGAQAELSCLPFGVTAAADAEGVLGDKQLLDTFMVKSAVFVKVPIADNKPDLSALRQKLHAYGSRAVGIKVFFDTLSTDVRDIRPLREVCEFAQANGLIVMVHSTNSPVPMAEIVKTLRKGDILTHAFHGGIHSAAAEHFQSIAQAKEKGVIIDLGLEGSVHTSFRCFEQAIRSALPPDILSTDLTKVSVYTKGGRYGLTLCMSVAKALGMDEVSIFKAVTSAPAKALGKANEWGSLKEGACADIAVLDYTDEGFDLTDIWGNRIRSAQGYTCVLTIADGRVVYRSK